MRAWALVVPVLLGCAGLAPAPPSSPVPAAELQEASATCRLEKAPSLHLSPPAIKRTVGPDRLNLSNWVYTLADPALRGRDSGSDEERAVAVLLASALSDLGIPGVFDRGEYCQPFTWAGRSDQNVVGVLRRSGGGGGPAVILGAHYDGQGRCGPEGEVCPSADDNASGVAALLEVARLLAARRSKLRGDVVIAFFGAEEQHIMGSSHFVRHPPIPFARVERMINLDMVGRQLLDGQPYRFLVCNQADAFGYVVGGPDREVSEDALERAAGRVGASVYGVSEGMLVAAGFTSDSVPFSAHVPTLFLSTSIHDDYHAPGDVPAKVDIGQVERAVRIVTALVLDP